MKIPAILLVAWSVLITSGAAASALEADIRAKADGGETPFIVGVTNLPDETKLMIGIRRKEASYFAQSHATVRAGQFKSEKFSALGKPLPPGNYEIEVTMPLAGVQPPAVRSVIGEGGERLTGKLVERSRFGIVLKTVSTINIGGTPSAAADAAARRDNDVAMDKWRRESCEWIQKVAQSRRSVAECVDQLSR